MPYLLEEAVTSELVYCDFPHVDTPGSGSEHKQPCVDCTLLDHVVRLQSVLPGGRGEAIVGTCKYCLELCFVDHAQ